MAVARLRLRVEIPWRAVRDRGRIDPAAASETAFDGRIATPFLLRLQDEADRASHTALLRLHHDNAVLLVEIQDRARAVVQAQERGERETVHHRRLGHDIAQWEIVASCAAESVGAVVADLNRMVDRYWGLVTSSTAAGTFLPPPRRIVRDALWDHPRALIPLRTTPQPATADTVLDRALAAVVVGTPS